MFIAEASGWAASHILSYTGPSIPPRNRNTVTPVNMDEAIAIRNTSPTLREGEVHDIVCHCTVSDFDVKCSTEIVLPWLGLSPLARVFVAPVCTGQHKSTTICSAELIKFVQCKLLDTVRHLLIAYPALASKLRRREVGRFRFHYSTIR